LRPSAGRLRAAAGAQAYLEGYGRKAPSLGVTYDLAKGDGGEAAATAPAARQATAAGDRAAFRSVLPIAQLEPGAYLLRAIVRSGDAIVTTIARQIEVVR
jgi:hypothetical protein